MHNAPSAVTGVAATCSGCCCSSDTPSWRRVFNPTVIAASLRGRASTPPGETHKVSHTKDWANCTVCWQTAPNELTDTARVHKIDSIIHAFDPDSNSIDKVMYILEKTLQLYKAWCWCNKMSLQKPWHSAAVLWCIWVTAGKLGVSKLGKGKNNAVVCDGAIPAGLVTCHDVSESPGQRCAHGF